MTTHTTENVNITDYNKHTFISVYFDHLIQDTKLEVPPFGFINLNNVIWKDGKFQLTETTTYWDSSDMTEFIDGLNCIITKISGDVEIKLDKAPTIGTDKYGGVFLTYFKKFDFDYDFTLPASNEILFELLNEFNTVIWSKSNSGSGSVSIPDILIYLLRFRVTVQTAINPLTDYSMIFSNMKVWEGESGSSENLVPTTLGLRGNKYWKFSREKTSTILTLSTRRPTKLTGGIDAVQTNIPVETTVGYVQEGAIKIDSEQITYNERDATNFLNVTRGANGSSASPHSLNANVFTANWIKDGWVWNYDVNDSFEMLHTRGKHPIEIWFDYEVVCHGTHLQARLYDNEDN